MPTKETAKVSIVRHGLQEKVEGLGQEEHPLSNLGIRQAKDRRAETFSGFKFERVYGSGLIRANNTASIIAGVPIEEVVTLPELFVPNEGLEEDVGAMFKRLGYASLLMYYTSNRHLIHTNLYDGWKAVQLEMFEHASSGDHFLMGCHAVFTPGFALVGADESRHEMKVSDHAKLWKGSIGCAEGVTLEIDLGTGEVVDVATHGEFDFKP